ERLSGTKAPHFFPHVEAARPAPDVLEFAPTWRAWAYAAIPIAIAALLVAGIVVLLSVVDGGPPGSDAAKVAAASVMAFGAVGLAGIGVEQATLRLRFDRAAGTMTQSSAVGRNTTWPLHGLIAVQCLYERHVSGKNGPTDYLQLNLVW